MNINRVRIEPDLSCAMERSERQELIRQRLAGTGRLGVGTLACELRVAPMTIRRDLAALERAGVLTRTHGGCVLQSPFVAERSFPEKQRRRREQKTAIARAAVRQLRRGDAVYFDTGTTALAVARALPPGLDLAVFTNNLRVAMELFGRSGVAVTVYGGALARQSPDLTGEITMAQIAQCRVDLAVVGGDALDLARGEFYAADTATAQLCRAAQRQADRVLLVMDSSKFGQRGRAVAGKLCRGVTLVTDHEVTAAARRRLQRTGATIVCAPPVPHQPGENR
jgi:DeoR/GlpR family transcriptional regulator of sugar metabolism